MRNCSTFGKASVVFTEGGYAFVADGEIGFLGIVVTDSAELRPVESYNTPDNANDTSVKRVIPIIVRVSLLK